MKNNTKKEILIGKNINLRNVTTADAAFILELRLNPELNAYLSKTDCGLTAQIEWIERYLQEENEFYFIIEDKDENSFGTVRIYDLQLDSFCWGSWIIHRDAPMNTAIESVLILYEFAFHKLGYKKSHFDVRKNNFKVIEFHRRFGAKITNESDIDYFFNFTVQDFDETKKRYKRFIS